MIVVPEPLRIPAASAAPLVCGGANGAARALALVEIAGKHSGVTVCVAASARDADQLSAELAFFGGPSLPVGHFPDYETLPYDNFSPHQDIISQRLRVLAELRKKSTGIVVVTAAALLQRLPPANYVAARSMSLQRGQKIDRDRFIASLLDSGYLRVPQIGEHGELAVRGSIIDVFPMGSDTPLRLDLFDDELDEIRTFDPDNQRTLATLETVAILPAREMPLDDVSIRDFRGRYRERFAGNANRSQIYRDVSQGISPPGIEYYLPLFFDATTTLFDFVSPSSLIVMTDDFEERIDSAWQNIEERYGITNLDVDRPVLAPDEVFLAPNDLRKRLDAFSRIVLGGPKPLDGIALNTRPEPPVRLDAGRAQASEALLTFIEDWDGRILFCAETAGRREALIELLNARALRPKRFDDWQSFSDYNNALGIVVAPLEKGAVIPDAGLAIITEQAIFGQRARQRSRRRSARDPALLVRQLSDLDVGTPVVHEEYGVGRFLGLNTLHVGGFDNEFLTLEYAGGDKLYVPVHALQLISRYAGASPESAPLHRLGSDQWARARKKAAQKIRDVAAELLDVFARRAARVGHSFHLDGSDYAAFCAGFPFEPTEDQQRVSEEIVDDMSSDNPMDRVVCGDVGFGKTEIALRAAFIAVQDGKQVGILAPTTLLAQQHAQTFADRFADWPVKVDVLSRFTGRKDVDRILAEMRAGTADIIIGTHKLLQHTDAFKDIGLVIIDEEHRFGVRHKEAIKSLRAEIDILTLTATPIPRTLNMALGGLRELSLIATPPSERLAVKTFVSQWNDAMIREACLREIKRGGQVYFVHNRVQDIEDIAEKISALVPEANLRIGHGQLPERELEQVMLDFYHRRFNVLLCTTIIESGLDVPSANTIVIDRADRFGLAQLHQLRGRVGRSHHRAYAYLIAPPKSSMTADAVKRLEAIDSLEDLGAGFALASHDLEIRGAGELLGDVQSGQIQEIGFSMYTELLTRTVEAMRRGDDIDLDAPLDGGVEINFHIPALLPEDYVPDVHLRLILYKRIASAGSRDELRELQVELIDRFGLLPEATKHLMRISELKLSCSALGIRKADAGPAGGYLLFAGKTTVNPAVLIDLVQTSPQHYRLAGPERLRFSADLQDIEQRLDFVANVIEQLSQS